MNQSELNHIKGFNAWMLKIRNIYYADQQRMESAFDRVINVKNK